MWEALAGGAMIGAAALLLYGGIGRIAGVSGIAFGMLEPGARAWRLPFVAGLVGGAWVAALAAGFPAAPLANPAWIAVAGVFVGLGTRLANGCTSGHGVCGIARLSPRSLAAVASFMLAGMIVATLARSLS